MGNPEIILKQIKIEKLKKQIYYSEENINKLFENIEKDFYGRLDFSKMQEVILNDRKVRLNYMIAETLNVPINKIHQKNKIDFSKHHFPLSIINLMNKVNKENPKASDWVFKKQKLNTQEQFYKKEVLAQRYQHLFERKHFYKENKEGVNFINSLNIMRK